jgi:transposase
MSTTRIEPRMRQIHRAGEKLFVDYAGMTVDVVDRDTGEVRAAQIFVATLGASNYTYAEATWTQTLSDWTGAHVRAFEFFGAAPRVLVPDNLKSGVTSPHIYEPDINPTYADMARHYGIAVVPARAGQPRDKAKVEVHVQIVERRVLARLRNRRFFSLDDLNEAIGALLETLNNAPFQKLDGTRRRLFEQIDRPAMQPLPVDPYVFAEWKKARVNIDYHIEVDRRYYSVPERFIKKQVDVRSTARIVEVLYNGERIASHLRAARAGERVTCPEHMPSSHRAHAQMPEVIASWLASAGEATEQAVRLMIARNIIPEQGYRSCLGVKRLGDRYGAARLEAACARILPSGYPSYKSIAAILRSGLDAAPAGDGRAKATPIEHANIRGADYYRTRSQQTELF